MEKVSSWPPPEDFRTDVDEVLCYVWLDELRDYVENERPKFHIFEYLVRVDQWVNDHSISAHQFADTYEKESQG